MKGTRTAIRFGDAFKAHGDATHGDAEACRRGIHQEIDEPCVSTGDPQLRNFDCATEAHQTNRKNPRPIWVSGCERGAGS